MNDRLAETGKWTGSTKSTVINGSHQIISDCEIVNTPSVWIKEGISPEDRIACAFNWLNAFIGEHRHTLSAQQEVELQRILNILLDTPITDEDRQWADRELRKLLEKSDD